MSGSLKTEVRLHLMAYMKQSVIEALDEGRGVVSYPETWNMALGNWRDEFNGRAAEVIKGLMEIAEMAMPDSFFHDDSRVNAAREFLKALD